MADTRVKCIAVIEVRMDKSIAVIEARIDKSIAVIEAIILNNIFNLSIEAEVCIK